MQIQQGKFVCGSCKKVCKSKGGLTRHQTAVHGTMTNIAQTSTTEPELKLAEDYIMQVIQETKKILENDMCYPCHIREEFSKLNGQNLDPEFIKVSQKLYRSFYKNADAEKFYTNFFSEIPLKSSHFFPTINKHAAMLLVLKFADCLVAFEKRRTAFVTKKTQEANYNKLSDHEENALQYLSGYVLHNLYKKITDSKNYNTDASQQALSFIKSARSVTNFTSQRLVNAFNRGGLWFATETAQGIFQQTEYAFREETSGQEVNKIDCPALTIKLLNSVDIKAKFNLLLGECDMEVDEKVGLDTLQQMISLERKSRSQVMELGVYPS